MITLFTISGKLDMYCAIDNEVITLTQSNLRDMYWGEEVITRDDTRATEYILAIVGNEFTATNAESSKIYSCELPWDLNTASLKEAYLDVIELRHILQQEMVNPDDTVYLKNGDGAIIPATSLGISKQGKQELAVASNKPVYVIYAQDDKPPLTVRDLQKIATREENSLITFSDENSIHTPIDFIDTDYAITEGEYGWLIGIDNTK